MKESRGVRNKNPGNIDYNKANQLSGQLGLEVGAPMTQRVASLPTELATTDAKIRELMINLHGITV